VLKNHGLKQATDYWWTGNHSVKQSVRSPKTLDSLLKIGYEYSYWAFLNKSKREFLSPPAIGRLNEIKTRTLVITAEYDIEVCKEIAEILNKQIPGATKISINGAGHLMNMDKPYEFNKVISKFIDEVSSQVEK
jgi:pimeloyl-ACP methyl ester carboxylesterase